MQSVSQKVHRSCNELVKSLQDTLKDEFTKIREELNIASAAEEAAVGTKKGGEFEDEIVANLNDHVPQIVSRERGKNRSERKRKVGDVTKFPMITR